MVVCLTKFQRKTSSLSGNGLEAILSYILTKNLVVFLLCQDNLSGTAWNSNEQFVWQEKSQVVVAFKTVA